MEFIRKHTPKLNREGLFIESANHEDGYMVAKCFLREDGSNTGSSEAKYNARLFGSSVDMLDCLIDRAKALYETKDWTSSTREEEDEEFDRIIGILKKAGVEVVE